MQITFIPKSDYEKFGQQICNTLVENFSQTFFVGGLVRNIFLQKSITDIDIATIATPNEVISVLTEHGISYDDTHAQFGIITVSFNNQSIEIATFRSDTYTNSRYPKITFESSVIEDSKRRDFTINSLYLQGKTQVLQDPQHGFEDLQNKIIRMIGDADTKLKEDPLRILRAYRLQLETDYTFDQNLTNALKNNMHLIQTLSQKKVQHELEKISDKNFRATLAKMLKSS